MLNGHIIEKPIRKFIYPRNLPENENIVFTKKYNTNPPLELNGLNMHSSRTSGYSGIGQILHDVNEFIFVKNKKITSIISIIMIVGLTFIVFNSEASAKAEDILYRSDILRILRDGGGGGKTFPGIEDKIDFQTTRRISGDLSEGQSAPEVIIENTRSKVLKYVKIEMTWEDESDPPGLPKIRNYENQPDEFSVSIVSPNNTAIISQTDNSGSIKDENALSIAEIEGSFGEGNFTLNIKLMSAGDWVPSNGPGLITYRDDENSYELILTMTHLEDEEK